MLEIDNIDVFYGGIHALRGVSLTVEEGEIVTLIGANGAGKTTTLRAISGLIKPTKGTVKFAGQWITGVAPHVIVGRGLVMAPEGRGIFANMTVEENLEIGAFLRRDKAGIAKDKEHALSLFPRLEERLGQNAGTLSGGEQQMLAIARALMSRPRVLLLDEPSLGIAPLLVRDIFKTIVEINQRGVTVLLVEQNAHMALGVAQRAYVLEVGKIVLEGPAKQLASDDKIRKAYLGIHE